MLGSASSSQLQDTLLSPNMLNRVQLSVISRAASVGSSAEWNTQQQQQQQQFNPWEPQLLPGQLQELVPFHGTSLSQICDLGGGPWCAARCSELQGLLLLECLVVMMAGQR